MMDFITYLFIAIAGLLIHVILKISAFKGKLFSGWTKRDTLITLASLIAIPNLILICTEEPFNTLFPVNYGTSFLIGYQTQSFLKSIGDIFGNRLNSKQNNNGTD